MPQPWAREGRVWPGRWRVCPELTRKVARCRRGMRGRRPGGSAVRPNLQRVPNPQWSQGTSLCPSAPPASTGLHSARQAWGCVQETRDLPPRLSGPAVGSPAPKDAGGCWPALRLCGLRIPAWSAMPQGHPGAPPAAPSGFLPRHRAAARSDTWGPPVDETLDHKCL